MLNSKKKLSDLSDGVSLSLTLDVFEHSECALKVSQQMLTRLRRQHSRQVLQLRLGLLGLRRQGELVSKVANISICHVVRIEYSDACAKK